MVTDKAGNPQAGLQQQDFTLLDSKQPQNILSFKAVDASTHDAEPQQVVFLIDAVNTGDRTLANERIQLEKFLRQDGGKLPVPTSLAVFTDKGAEMQPGTTRDGNVLADILNSKQIGMRFIGRAQGFYGAEDRMNLSLTTLERFTSYEAAKPGRKLLVWISPGWPLLTGPGIQLTTKNEEWLFNNIVALSKHMRDARLTLYSIDPLGMSDAGGFRTFYYQSFLKGVAFPNKSQGGNLALQVLATQSGGRVLNSNNDLSELMSSCLLDARAYYTVSFDAPPADHPDEYHSLEVKIDKPGLTARTRTGYYAQPYKSERGGTNH